MILISSTKYKKINKMKTNTLISLALITIGIIAFTYQGITWKSREKAFDLGSVHITTEKTNTIPLPPIVGGIALVVGIGLLITQKNSHRTFVEGD
jgi:hypothetical protein